MHEKGSGSPSVISLLAVCSVPLLVMAWWQERKKAVLVRKAIETAIDEQRGQLAQLSRVAMLCNLSGAIAHEINQPLTAILINTEAALRMLGRDSMDAGPLRETLSDILVSTRHALRVVQGLRALLRDGDTQRVSLDLNEAVRSALALTRSDLTRWQVDVKTHLEPRLACVHGDGVQIEQVILNLVMNACEAMVETPAEQRYLQLATHNGPGSSEVELTVCDRGAGVAPSQLERIFQPFVTSKYSGLGLGLSISRSIVEAHGGRIWAENASSGATFHLTLPTAAMKAAD